MRSMLYNGKLILTRTWEERASGNARLPRFGCIGIALGNFAILVILLLTTPVLAGELLHGRARVTDGDTLRVGGVAVRLEGIAAPELAEHGGPEAAAFLRGLVEGREVVCELTGARSYRRRVGVCFRQGEDLAAAVIGAGLARDCWRYSKGRYAAVEPASAGGLPLPGYCTPR